MKEKHTSLQRFYLGDNYPGIYLTKLEATCVAGLPHNLLYKEIAKIIGISPSIISFYIYNVRRKLKCINKEQLVEIIRETDFMDNLPAYHHIFEDYPKATEEAKNIKT